VDYSTVNSDVPMISVMQISNKSNGLIKIQKW